MVIPSRRLADSSADLVPDLAAISTGVIDHQGPALVFGADHPYATGFQVTDRQTVAVLTRYGTLAPQPLVYLVR